MPPRASWKGHLKLSLLSIPVRMYNAVSSSSKIRLNQLHKDCDNRIKYQNTCPEHGPVERSDIVKGYEYEKGKYVVIEQDALEGIQLETNKVVELVQFVDADEVDSMLYNSHYYVAPDGPVAEEAFRVLRDALQESGKVGIGRVVLSGREHVVRLEPEDAGFVLTTLRYAYEVRGSTAYFEDIADSEPDEAQVGLARQLIESHVGAFAPTDYVDRYEDALLSLIKARVQGEEPVLVQEREVGKVIDLMEALKGSLEMSSQAEKKPAAKSKSAGKGASKKKPPAGSVKKAGAKKRKAG